MYINKDTIILGIESSCDETSAAVTVNGELLSNYIAGQKVHEKYGGVVPELASRAHQQNIVPVVDTALKDAGVKKSEISAIAFTRGPGLLGSLLVGTSFAKSLSQALNIPLIDINHMQAHVLAHFIRKKGEEKTVPSFPFICLTVSGGHTQLVLVKSYFEMEIIGATIDDAAGEAFDKAAKLMGLPYPGGPLIDKIAEAGNPLAFTFNEPQVKNYDYSFSGLKTNILYFLQDELKKDEQFTEKNKADLCASIQHTIVTILLKKLKKSAAAYNVSDVAIAGGVSANSYLRKKLVELGAEKNWQVFIPPFEYCTDNAAMIAMAGHFKFQKNEFCGMDITPLARMDF